MKLAIISGGTPPRLRSHINHAVYARLHGLCYHRDTRTYPNLQTPHFHKISAVRRILDRYDWVMWMDDDAYFTDFTFDVANIVRAQDDETFFVACKSPINAQGGWTFLNSGVFFIKNSALSKQFLEDVFNAPKPDVERHWNSEIYGMLTPGEQAHIIHILHAQGLLGKARLYDWSAFNARPFHWRDGDDIQKYPIVHFPGSYNKHKAIEEFGSKFGRDDTLAPIDISDDVKPSAEADAARRDRLDTAN